MTYQFIAEHQGMTPVKWMCQALGVSQSGYYAWKRRPPSRRSQEDHVLAERIEQISQASRRTYGGFTGPADQRHVGSGCRWTPDRWWNLGFITTLPHGLP